MLNFNFLRKGLGIVSQQILCMIFQKMLLMLYSINWPNVIIWLSLLLEILSNMWIAIDCWPGCDIIDFEISPIFITKPFLYITKKSRQKFKYLEKEKSFKGEKEVIFIIFRGLLAAKKCLRLESSPLNKSTFNYRFVKILMAFNWTLGTKGLRDFDVRIRITNKDVLLPYLFVVCLLIILKKL